MPQIDYRITNIKKNMRRIDLKVKDLLEQKEKFKYQLDLVQKLNQLQSDNDMLYENLFNWSKKEKDQYNTNLNEIKRLSDKIGPWEYTDGVYIF